MGILGLLNLECDNDNFRQHYSIENKKRTKNKRII